MAKANLYADFFNKILREDMTAGDGGAFGDTAKIFSDTNITTTDSYAPGDSRNMFGNNIKPDIQTRKKTIKSKKKSKKTKKNKKKYNKTGD